MPKQWKQLTVKFEPEMLKRIALEAAEEGVSKGEWVRVAVQEKMAQTSAMYIINTHGIKKGE
jgi:predicted HicB family RNase H-like nuclease